MTFQVAAYGALAVFLGVLGLLVWAARPASRVNQLFGALLLLEGAADLAFQLMREAPTAEAALHWNRLAHYYIVPEAVIAALLLHRLFPARRPRLRLAGLVAVTALGAADLFAFIVNPESVVAASPSGSGFNIVTPALLTPDTLLRAAHHIIQFAFVLLAAKRVAQATASRLERQQAALVGLGFLILLGTAIVSNLVGMVAYGFNLRGQYPRWPDEASRVLLALLLSAMLPWLLVALARLPSAFEGRARQVALLAGASPLAFVALNDTVLGLDRIAGGAGYGLFDRLVPSLFNVRILWVALFAAILALALVRFGLAGFGERAREHIARVSQAILLGSVALLPIGAALALAGGDSNALAVAAVVSVAALALSPAPLRSVARRFAAAFTVRPEDTQALAERVRLYEEALDQHLDPQGGLGDTTRLHELREELGISEREHAFMLHALQRHRQGPHQEEGALLGRYLVERELGRGAFATAYLATDPVTKGYVVLKRFHATKAHKRAFAEAKALAAVRHPRVLRLLETQQVGEEVFLVLAYAEGGNLAQLLEREGRLPPDRALRLASDVLEGLDALHAAGLVHRDVKPSNILLDREGRALLGDFGAARFAQGPGAELTVTGTDVLGSYVTLAPEVLQGERATEAADIYAMGAVLFRMLTGEHYVHLEGKTAFQARQLILQGKPRLPHPRVPKELEPVLRRALAKDPRKRFASASGFVAALEVRAAEQARAPVRVRSGVKNLDPTTS